MWSRLKMTNYTEVEGLGIDDLSEEQLDGIDKRTLKKLQKGEVFLGGIGGTGPRIEVDPKNALTERRALVRKRPFIQIFR
jgi:hypothetical protein